MPLVRLEGATLANGERRLLGPITLDLWLGERLCITGPPASGKSLLLEVLAGRNLLNSGHRSYPAFTQWNADCALGVPARFAIRMVSTEEQRRISTQVATFHQARWHAQFSEPDTVAMMLSDRRAHGLNEFEVPPEGLIDPAHEERCHRLATRMGIEPLLSRRLVALSNGEMRKVLIAQAILARPRILLLDDPLGGIDPESRPRIVEVLAEVCSSAMLGSSSTELTTPWRPPSVPLTMVIATPRPEEMETLMTRSFELASLEDSVPSRQTLEKAADPHVSSMGVRSSMLSSVNEGNNAPKLLVRMNNASVVTGSSRILRSISFEVHTGEQWLITGPNGSGKSTLLALLLGDHPQSYVADLEVLGMRAGPGTTRFQRQRQIGFMAPELALHYPPGWCVQHVVLSGFNATIGIYSEPSPIEQQTARLWMEHMGLDVKASVPFGRLSEAEQRRTLLARALVRTPRLLLLDEPTQGLSTVERRALHDLLDTVVDSSQTSLLLVSHHPEERPRCITHQLALREGNIVRRGPLRND